MIVAQAVMVAEATLTCFGYISAGCVKAEALFVFLISHFSFTSLYVLLVALEMICVTVYGLDEINIMMSLEFTVCNTFEFQNCILHLGFRHQ